ncbi:MAG: delta-60 repeat domain-containing protein [Actinomycetota bacterium]|nr:delta-60 repeat domain-containing protein [Actinomycetota bacterium]
MVATNVAGTATATSAQTAVVQGLPPANTAAPTVSGTTTQGATLTGGLGSWSGSPSSYTQQWQRCDSAGANCAIVGSAGGTYPLTAADVGQTLRFRVTATNAWGSTVARSLQTAVIAAAPPANSTAPVVSGTVSEGQTISTSDGTWTYSPTSYAYQWQRSNAAGGYDDISGATSSTYKLVAADVDKRVRARVTATNAGGSAIAHSAATALVVTDRPVNTALPTIAGTTTEGSTLTGAVGTWSGSPATYARQWRRCDGTGANCVDIAGATGATHVLSAADINKTIRFQVTATNATATATATSSQTAIVRGLPPTNTSPPFISGTATEGSLLRAEEGTWTGTPTYMYEWQRCDSAGANCAAIPEHSGSGALILGSADIGKTIRVRITASNNYGSATMTTPATAQVAASPPANTTLPRIEGFTNVGATLTGHDGVWSFVNSYARQWRRCDAAGANCLDIAGATGSSYVVTSTDVGKTIRFRVTGTSTAGTKAVDSDSRSIAAAPTGLPLVFFGGSVNAVAPLADGGIAVGGTFTQVGAERNLVQLPKAGAGDTPNRSVVLKNASGQRVWPDAIVDDGSGGIYVGGAFTQVNGVARTNLARIDSTGAVTTFNPAPNATVRTLTRSGTTLYVGGDFTTIGGQSRSRLAALSSTGAPTTWAPNPNDIVAAMDIGPNGVLYAVGSFTTASGATRNRAAAWQVSTGALTSWSPNADATVWGLELVTSATAVTAVYLSGNFTTVGTTPRNMVARVDAAGAVQPWSPSFDSRPQAMQVAANGTLYVGGAFTTVNGVSRSRAAAIASDGSLTGWNPNADQTVYAIELDEAASTAYLGGSFNNVGTSPRAKVAAVDMSAGAVTTWNPRAAGSGETMRMLTSGTNIWVGGTFPTIANPQRSGLAKIDSAGQLTSWSPTVSGNSGSVNAFTTIGSTLYVGGSFTSIAGQSRASIAAFDGSGALTTFNPGVQGSVYSLAAADGNRIYVGGSFTQLNGNALNNLGAVTTTGGWVGFNPGPNGRVNALLVDGDRLYAGGAFTTATGRARNRAASWERSTTFVTDWNPDMNGAVNAITRAGGNIYLGGAFTTAGGLAQPYLAGYSATTGAAVSTPTPNSGVSALLGVGNKLYVGGAFSTFAGQSRIKAAAWDVGTSTLSAWALSSRASGNVAALGATGPIVASGSNAVWEHNGLTLSPPAP